MMDLKTRMEVLPCGKCEDMMDCDLCIFQKEAKELYQQIRADAIEEFRNKLFGKLVRLTLSMWHFKLFDDALQETYSELKEQNNDSSTVN